MPIRSATRIVYCALALCLCALSLAQDFVPNEVLVKFRPGHGLYELVGPLSLDAKLRQELPRIGVQRLSLRPNLGVMNAVRRLRRMGFVEFAEPNYIVRAFETPNDAFFPDQWNMRKISAPEGWDFTHGASAVIIAIIDTGVDLDHPDLQSKLVAGTDIVEGDGIPDDDNGHGTHVAGIAAAATNNSIGVAGVGYDCRIMPVKALDAQGSGLTSDVAAGISFAVTNGAKVVSLSLGSPSNSSTMQSAVNNAWNSGVLVVAASGNDGTSALSYPAAHTNAIAVGATDANDARASFSNFGPWVDVAAPGTDILSTYINNQYAYTSGTSMSTPHVAGLGGLLWAFLGPTTSVATIRQRIEDNTIPIGTWLARGRIDVRRSVLNLGPPVIVRRTTVPTSTAILAGTVLSGNLASLLTSDDVRLNMMATRVGTGRGTQFYVEATTAWSGQKLAIETTVEAQTAPGGILRVSYWNWAMSRWDLIGTKVLSGTDRGVVFSSTNPNLYLNGLDQSRILVERNESRNLLFWLRTDKVEITSLSQE